VIAMLLAGTEHYEGLAPVQDHAWLPAQERKRSG
jgi:hypothetical protein